MWDIDPRGLWDDRIGRLYRARVLRVWSIAGHGRRRRQGFEGAREGGAHEPRKVGAGGRVAEDFVHHVIGHHVDTPRERLDLSLDQLG
jgi:hypothetical protein